MFERIVIGVEESPESLVAVRQAARLLEPDGRLVLTAVADVALAVDAGWAATHVLEDVESEARTALSAAWAEAPGAEAVLLDGAPADALLKAARNEGADLVAVGIHGGSRTKGILLGSVATLMLHEAPCRCSLQGRRPTMRNFHGLSAWVSTDHRARPKLRRSLANLHSVSTPP